ncbi:hypothetical protein [Sphingorhabdus lutea]|uniref:hypothetical protein n=1 Tax=Sphingorhabdus lutea TaxID=1913578 RepID=UPI000B051A37|nr:hypothetical protein [Sphingorhabdus lutea]
MNLDLLTALLSYNRGYNVGIRNIGRVGSKLGKAKITSESDFQPGSDELKQGCAV